jgi:hypothetical protein
MNVRADTDFQTLEQIQLDSRQFPESLIHEHKRAARFGRLAIMTTALLIATAVKAVAMRLFGVLQKLFAFIWK